MYRTPLKVTLLLIVPLLLWLAVTSPALQAGRGSFTHSPAPLTFNDRLACQRAVEEVYHAHRTWPEENSGSKLPLDTVLPDEVLVKRAEDAVRFSNALAALWHQPITGDMLQAELSRMAGGSRAPDLLHALFAALGNNPVRIAECLVRPALAERLIRDHYAFDDRYHGVLEREAQAALEGLDTVDALREAGGSYRENTWLLGEAATVTRADDGVTVLDAEAWVAARERLAAYFGVDAAGLRAGAISGLQEDEGGYFAVALLDVNGDRLRVGTVRWNKVPFSDWWSDHRDRYATELSVPAFDYRLPEVARPRGGDGSWLATPSMPTRLNGTAVWTGSEMIVWGGGSLGTGRSNEGWAYNPAIDTWMTINVIGAPEGRYRHTAVWSGSEMIVWGGCGSTSYRLCERSTGGRYNPATGTWTPTSLTNVPTGRIDHTAVWAGAEMIVWGGCQPVTDASCEELNSGGRYDPTTDTWTPMSVTNAPTGRTGHSAIWSGSEMIVWGGSDAVNRTDSGGRYNPATDRWMATSTALAPSPRADHTAIWTGNEMIVWGGCPQAAGCVVQGDPLATGSRYNPATNTWTPMNATAEPSARTGHSAVWTGSEMIVWGGATSNNIYFNDGGRYNPTTDRWSPVTTAGAPGARAYHAAVWTGSEMIVWGSTSITGGRYDPDTNSWTPTDTEDPDSLRAMHTAVWTGVEMIVWGGEDIPEGITDTGRIYRPATREWREVTMEGRPVFRRFHTALWTGSEMLIWGGGAGSSLVGDGGRYNPASDSWQPITMTDAPEPRAYHAAVWTGNEMVVWGGQGMESDLATGGRYNPATNRWQPTATAGAPPGRYLFTGVWDGDELLVWGGLVQDGESNTGGKYNPATDHWTTMSLTDAPAPRHFHTAVWSGAEMIVWGGTDFYAGIIYNDGGRYDPDTDRWQPLTTSGAPSPRTEHTAVWTGAEMIVWGGCDGVYCGTPQHTGGHYDPATDTWEATSLAGSVPRARGEHTAIWTGERMIVWGGYTTASSYTNTGAEYLVDAPGNQPPVAAADEYATVANTPLAVAAPGVLGNDSDSDGDSLTAVLVTLPEHGTLTLMGSGGFTYTPEAGFSGSDTFAYRVWDGLAYSQNAGVTISVAPPGSTPTATSTGVPPSPTATATGIPPGVTPTATATGIPPTVSPTATMTPIPPGVTPSATGVVPSATPTSQGVRLFLPLVAAE